VAAGVIEVQGTLREDGTLVPDEKPALPPGVRFAQVFSCTNRISGGAAGDVPRDGHNDMKTNHRDCGLMTDTRRRPAHGRVGQRHQGTDRLTRIA